MGQAFPTTPGSSEGQSTLFFLSPSLSSWAWLVVELRNEFEFSGHANRLIDGGSLIRRGNYSWKIHANQQWSKRVQWQEVRGQKGPAVNLYSTHSEESIVMAPWEVIRKTGHRIKWTLTMINGEHKEGKNKGCSCLNGIKLSFDGPNLATACILNVSQCNKDGYCAIECNYFYRIVFIPLGYTLAWNNWTCLTKKVFLFFNIITL